MFIKCWPSYNRNQLCEWIRSSLKPNLFYLLFFFRFASVVPHPFRARSCHLRFESNSFYVTKGCITATVKVLSCQFCQFCQTDRSIPFLFVQNIHFKVDVNFSVWQQIHSLYETEHVLVLDLLSVCAIVCSCGSKCTFKPLPPLVSLSTWRPWMGWNSTSW